MHAKCQCNEDAQKVFDRMNNANAISWNAMIVGCTVNDQSAEALKLFCQMQRKGTQLDEVTFAVVMSACATLASLELGKHIHVDIYV